MFKYDSIESMFDPAVFCMVGLPFGAIRSILELKTWYTTGHYATTTKCTRMAKLVETGCSNQELIKADPGWVLKNLRDVDAFRMELDRSKPFVPVRPPLIDLDTAPVLHRSWPIFYRFWNTAICTGNARKGWGWIHLWGKSNVFKTKFVNDTFCSILPCATVLFVKGWPQGFAENKYQCIVVDGLSSETVANGFTSQLMEQATAGIDGSFEFPVKYAVRSPVTHGEIWVTTGNHPLRHVMGEDVYTNIVAMRATEIEVRVESYLPALANVIRRNSGLEAIDIPNLVRPETFQFTQSQ